MVLALADATWARQGVAEPPALGTAFVADAGVVLPATLLIGVIVGLASWAVHPRAEPSVGRLLERLSDAGAGRPADIAAFTPLCALGLFSWATLSAQLARIVLAADAGALLTGSVLTLGSLCIGGVVALAVLALTPMLRQKLASWRSRWPAAVSPGATLLVALSIIVVMVTTGAATGTVSGEGGVFGIYGILKRQELDLRLPGMMVLLALACYLLPATLRALRPWHGGAAAVLAVAFTWRAAGALDAYPALGPMLERNAPLGARTLRLLRRLTDRDGDGASPTFGGGDCDDASASVGPGADDVPDNGVDEDCSGSDLSLAGLPVPAPQPDSAVVATKVPKDGNVVLITIDTLRYDVGFMGYPQPVSPHIDVLAKRSVVFERAYALASYTGKSVGPMLIGKYGSETHRNWGHFNKFGSEDVFVAERLQKAGVHTVAVHGHRYFGAWGGLERGFTILDLSAAPPEGAKWATDTTVTGDEITDAAIARLGERPTDKRFFLWVHYLDPHADYLAHEGVAKFGSSARAMYDGEVAFTDRQVGRLLHAVAADPAAARTSIIVTSDHGEAFGEHNMWRHGVEVWEVLVRVPLVVHVPGVSPRRIAARRSLIDLVPTLLELLGVPGPAGAEHDFLSGVSLLPDVFAASGAEPPSRDIFVDMPAGPYNEERQAFIHGDLKLVVSGGARKELFDLAADPGEQNNVLATRKGEIEAPFALFKKRLKVVEIARPDD